MYENHLKLALARAWGKRAQYMIVEDGDRKGNASGKGIEAKARCKILATTLPPRTPFSNAIGLFHLVRHRGESRFWRSEGRRVERGFLGAFGDGGCVLAERLRQVHDWPDEVQHSGIGGCPRPRAQE